jgi:hypothetical protein
LGAWADTQWIWHDNKGQAIKPDEVCFLRKTFRLDQTGEGSPSISADDEATVYLNGRQVASPTGFDKPAIEDVSSDLRKENVIAIAPEHHERPGRCLAVIQVTLDETDQFITTDTTWLSSKEQGRLAQPASRTNLDPCRQPGKLGDSLGECQGSSSDFR